MSVVISWSGARSQSVAEAVRDALSVGIQQSDPWMSSNDIPPGAFWGEDLRLALEAASAGILCVTPENVTEPWILFEAGALAKGIGGSKSYACVLLVGLAPSELPGPLAQLQAVAADHDGLERIFDRINTLCAKPLKEDAKKKAFDLVWPGLDAALKRVSSLPAPSPAKKRSESEKIDEILNIARDLARTNAQAPPSLSGWRPGTLRSRLVPDYSAITDYLGDLESLRTEYAAQAISSSKVVCPICREFGVTFPSEVRGIHCPRCGKYEITSEAITAIVAKSPDRILPLQQQTLAAQTRGEVLRVTREMIENL